jgi:hypothetical protein
LQYLRRISGGGQSTAAVINSAGVAACARIVQREERRRLIARCFVGKRRLIRAGALKVDLYDRLVLQVQRHVGVEQRVVVAAPHVEQHLPHRPA